MCCSVLQCVAVCCSVSQCCVVCCGFELVVVCGAAYGNALQRVAVRCSALLCLMVLIRCCLVDGWRCLCVCVGRQIVVNTHK